MNMHIDKTRADEFSAGMNGSVGRHLSVFAALGDDFNDFMILDEDIGNRVQMTRVDNSSTLYPG
jgi:hypothetical protein